jgi:hypothetical protein
MEFEISNHDVADGYGEFTWVIELADGRSIYAVADEMNILDAGVLELRRTTTVRDDGVRVPCDPISTLFIRAAAYTCAYITEKMHPAAVASLAAPTEDHPVEIQPVYGRYSTKVRSQRKATA